VVIPGGDVTPLMGDTAALEWIRNLSKGDATIFSVCNGASVSGKLGLLDGLTVTTHHSNLRILK